MFNEFNKINKAAVKYILNVFARVERETYELRMDIAKLNG